MFRELLTILRSKDPLRGMYDDLLSMIEISERMFEMAWQEAVSGAPTREVGERIRCMDVEVNKAERGIRKALVEHVVAYGWGDLPACLALMSVVKDAERLGDYCKQIRDAAEKQAQGLSQSRAFAEFQAIQEDVRSLFAKTRRALAESDTALAKEVMLTERAVRKHCDALLDVIMAEDLPSRCGIPWGLITRYLKRIAGHLSNIASSLVMPLHKLDYHDTDFLRGQDAQAQGQDG